MTPNRQVLLRRRTRPHLFFWDGRWHVGLRGSRTEGWPFDSFGRAVHFATILDSEGLR